MPAAGGARVPAGPQSPSSMKALTKAVFLCYREHNCSRCIPHCIREPRAASSVDRALVSGTKGRGFDPRAALQRKIKDLARLAESFSGCGNSVPHNIPHTLPIPPSQRDSLPLRPPISLRCRFNRSQLLNLTWRHTRLQAALFVLVSHPQPRGARILRRACRYGLVPADSTPPVREGLLCQDFFTASPPGPTLIHPRFP